MSEPKIYAGIVVFNPNIKRLQDNLNAICCQVDRVILFDNGSSQQFKVKQVIKRYNNTELICSTKNLGIAAALNYLMKWGYDRKYNWMLSLDQDSVCDKDFVQKMKKNLIPNSRQGIVAPIIKDRNIGIVGHNPTNKIERVRTCITSGAFTNMNVWKEVGGYDEAMFIDSVDFEFCYRVRKSGYEVLQVHDVYLLHEIGESQRKRLLFWNVTVNGHSAFRKFYIAQNNIYYPLKHNLIFHLIRGNFRNLKLLSIILLYEDCKKEKIKAVLKGWINGYKLRGVVNYEN